MLVAGAVVAAVLLFSFVDDLTGASRFTTGRPVEAELGAGAERTIYTAVNSAGSPSVLEPACQVTELASGQPVPTRPAGAVTLTLGDDVYRSLAHFEVSRDGRYRVACNAGTTTEMAVGPRLRVFRSAGRIVAAIGTGVLALALGATIIAVTAVKRHRRQKPAGGRPVP